MHQKLLRQAGLLAVVLLTTGFVLTGCIDEPNPPVLDRITSEIRFIHASPDAPSVDVYVDEIKVVSSVGYKGFSNYLEVKSGNRFLRLVPAGGDTSQAVFRRQVSVRSFTKITMAFHGSATDVQLLATQERFTYADETSKLVDSCDVKLININSGGDAVKLAVKEGETGARDIIPSVNMASLSSYRRVLSESNEYYLINANNQRVVTIPFEFKKPGYRYSVLFIGTSLSREALVLQDEPYQK
ncbi:MAG: DUF4397 domain-containing protein [Bacteroidia bacterium]|nr:DUF4397 domain-containing protein [Bacteroidia bacterium]